MEAQQPARSIGLDIVQAQRLAASVCVLEDHLVGVPSAHSAAAAAEGAAVAAACAAQQGTAQHS